MNCANHKNRGDRSGRRFARVFLVLALVFLLTGGAAVVSILRVASQQPNAQRQAAISVQGHEGFYWRHSLWLADARTCANMIAYLLSHDGHPGTNAVVNG